jgi:hypothetical protein
MKSRTSHLFALALILGSLAGIGLSIVTLFASFIRGTGFSMIVSAAFSVAFIALFSWAMHVGMLLFTGKPKGWRWAIVLYASQIPIVITGWLHYEWFTALQMGVFFQPVAHNLRLGFSVKIGADVLLQFMLRQAQSGVGINLFALMAVILLIGKRRQLMRETCLSASTTESTDSTTESSSLTQV